MGENNKLEKKRPSSQLLKENTQYVLGFTVIAGMLLLTGLPVFVVFFFAVLAFFIWRTVASPGSGGVREVFEFYLVANEILRDDERRWYGFEIQDAIGRGENIVRNMPAAPPLVSFALGALYRKLGDHQTAVKHLSYVVENEASDESRFMFPSPELKNYVATLRKIEREPAEAPLMSTAVRALERARRNRAASMLESSRAEIDREVIEAAELESDRALPRSMTEHFETEKAENRDESDAKASEHSGRLTISEVLRDIYDSKT